MSSFSDSIKRLFKSGGAEAREDAPSAPGATRRSNGLAEFWREMAGQEGLRILDLGATSQANINFCISHGHKIYTDDFYQALHDDSYFVVEDGNRRFDSDKFIADNLNYQILLFDAVLCWDAFDQLDESAQRPVVERLHRIVKPGGLLLAFFHTGEPGTTLPVYKYSMRTADTLELQQRGQLKIRRPLNNRNIENLFKEFHSLKFFLSRDNLREVLVVR